MTSRLMVLAACLALAAGCGADPLPLADFPEAFEHATCELSARCGLVSDIASCEQGTAYDGSQVQASVAAGRASYDGEAAGACIDAVAALSCAALSRDLAACDDVFTGTLVDGATCWFNFECASDRCVKVQCDRQCCTGVCMPRSGEGAACQSAIDCAPGLICQGEGGGLPSTCHRRVAAGEDCMTSADCGPDAYCSIVFGPSDIPEGGTCLQTAAPGLACDGSFPDESCQGVDEFCDPDTQRCVARAAVGAACDTLHAGLSFRGDTCRFEAYCDFSGDRTCRDWPAAGMPCQNELCARGYQCDTNDMCVPTPVPVACP
jgi:hypothetical protein